MQLWQYCLLKTSFFCWNKSCVDVKVGEHCTIPWPWTHDKHQWLLLQFIVLLKMDAKGVRNMQSIRVVFNKHNTARVASCWFIIYYIICMYISGSKRFSTLSDTQSPLLPIFPLAFIQVSFVRGLLYSFHPVFLLILYSQNSRP